MLNTLGFSVYLSTFEDQWPMLRNWAGTDSPVFLSLHINEEFGVEYCSRAEAICHRLADHGFRIIADVSTKTAHQFSEPNLIRLAMRLRVWALRIDDGFSSEEICSMAERMPIVVNASTTAEDEARAIYRRGQEVFALHNFYPRPETGLDEDILMRTTKMLQNSGLKVQAFIPGDTQKRGPVFQGLPTLEEHRNALPSAAFVDLTLRFGIDHVFLGDPGISPMEQQRITRFCTQDIISVPAALEEEYAYLYDQVFTCRVDSPKWLVRFMESRLYSCMGRSVQPHRCINRERGAITMDNVDYGRYSGEIQMIRSAREADERVNVIGHVPPNAHLLMDCIAGGQRFVLVRP